MGTSTYYANAIGKTGPTLRASLHDIIDGHTHLSYDKVWKALKDTDQDSFEPRDAVKGDVARMAHYLAIRYEGGDGFNDLEMSSLESAPHVHPLPLRPLGIAPEPFEMGGVVYGSVLGVSPVGATSVPGISPRATRPTSA